MVVTKKTSQNIKSGISQQPLIGSSSNIHVNLEDQMKSGILFEMKTIFNGRRPQNIKVEIN